MALLEVIPASAIFHFHGLAKRGYAGFIFVTRQRSLQSLNTFRYC
jgi:hypothetical protein